MVFDNASFIDLIARCGGRRCQGRRSRKCSGAGSVGPNGSSVTASACREKNWLKRFATAERRPCDHRILGP